MAWDYCARNPDSASPKSNTHEKSNVANLGNRPTSLLLTLAKIMKKIIKKMQFLLATTSALMGSAVALHAGQPVSVSVHFNGVDGIGIDNNQTTSLLP